MDHLLSKEKVSVTDSSDPMAMVDEGGTVILFNFEGPRILDLENLKRGCSSAGRAPALQAGGREFEPHHLHQDAGKEPARDDDGAEGNGPIAQQVRARA